MRRPVVAGNWKMHTTRAEADALASHAREHLADLPVTVILCPPFVWLERVARWLEGTDVGVGAQDVFWKDTGAYTGEVSPTQLAEVCDYVIVGHSERRAMFGDTDETVHRKAAAALRAGLTPIVAVGEREEEHEQGRAREVVERQVRAALADLPGRDLMVAYEPVWAIGTGKPATPEIAQAMSARIREVLRDLGLPGDEIPILYGGSVTADTFGGFAEQPDVDGALVGGASLRAEELARIATIATDAHATS